ncbi:MAG: glycosyltransferase family 87 protein [Mycobacteriales bacterium]|nr:glycosyltransferase family 87 protein [Mycobacteriales bacterium]
MSFAVVAFVHYMAGAYLQKGYPYSTPFYRPDDRFPGAAESAGAGRHLFGDFYQMWSITKLDSPYDSADPLRASNYPPLVHFVLRPFTWLPYDVAAAVFLGLLAAAMVAIAYAVLPGQGSARVLAAVVLGALTYPFLFLVDRGNVDGFALVFVASALLLRQRWWFQRPVLLALAAAIKVYPAVYGALFIRDRQWRELAVWVATGAVVTVTALSVFENGPVEEALLFIDSLKSFAAQTGGTSSHFVQHTASLISMTNGYVGLGVLPDEARYVAAALSLAFAALLGAFIVFVRMKLWQASFLLATMATVCMSASYDYRLCFFIVPLLLLIRDESEVQWPARAFTVLFALVLVPKSLPIVYNDVSVGPFINPPLITMIAVLVMVAAWRARRTAAAREAVAASAVARPEPAAV